MEPTPIPPPAPLNSSGVFGYAFAALLIGAVLYLTGIHQFPASAPASSPAPAAQSQTAAGILSGAALSAAVWESQVSSYSGYPSPANCYDKLSSYEHRNAWWAGATNCNNSTDYAYGVYPPFHLNAGVFNAHPSGGSGTTILLNAILNPNATVQGPDEWVGPLPPEWGLPQTDEGCNTAYEEGSLVYKTSGSNGAGCYRPNYYYTSSWSYSPSSVGTPVSVMVGDSVTLEWACQPSQTVTITYCQQYFRGCWNTKEGSYTVPYSSSATAAGSSEFTGTKGVTGSVVVHPQTTTTYSLTCGTYPPNPPNGLWYWFSYQGGSGEGHLVYSGIQNRTPAAMNITVNVSQIPASPTAHITADSSSVQLGQSVGIHSDFAVASGDTMTGSAINMPLNTNVTPTTAATHKDYTFRPTAAGTYMFYAWVQSQYHPWASYDSVTVVAGAPPAPVLGLSADPNPAPFNQPTTLTWSATNTGNIDSCTLSGGQWGAGSSVAANSSIATNPLTAGVTYSFSCHDTYYGTLGPVSQPVTVGAAGAPTATITTDAGTIYVGQTANIHATFTATGGDALVEDNIDSPEGTGLTGSTAPGPKDYAFTPSAAGDYTFYARATSAQYTSWTTYNSVVVHVLQPAQPSATISADSGSIYVGQSTGIHATYSADAGDTLTGTAIEEPLGNAVTGTTALSTRNYTFTPSSSGTYTFHATAKSSQYPTWTSYQSTVVSVSSINPGCNGTNCSGPSTSPGYVPGPPGSPVTLSWSCNPAIYTSSQGDTHYSTGGALSGSVTVNPTETTTYSVTCISLGGNSSGTVTITVLQPSLTITADHTKVKKNDTVNIAWSATNVTAGSCSVTGTDGSHWTGPSGSQNPTIVAATTFTLRCTVPAGPVSQSVTVNLLPNVIET